MITPRYRFSQNGGASCCTWVARSPVAFPGLFSGTPALPQRAKPQMLIMTPSCRLQTSTIWVTLTLQVRLLSQGSTLTSGTQTRCAYSQETLPRGCPSWNNSDLFIITAGSLAPTGQSHGSFTQMAQQSLLCSTLSTSGLHRLRCSQHSSLQAPTQQPTEPLTLNGFLAQSSTVLHSPTQNNMVMSVKATLHSNLF